MKKVMVIYHSQEFGNTAACARLIAQGIQEAGDLQVELVNTNETNRVDLQALAACDGVAIGSPDYGSYVAGTIKQLFDDLYVAKKGGLVIQGKPCVLFMTHGGGGRGISALQQMARNFQLVAAPFVCQGAPEEHCAAAVALGLKLGQVVLG